MKNLLVCLFALLVSEFAAGQNSNVILFTENGERFTVILNGVRQNAKPETNIKIVDLNAPQYKMKIIFEDIKLGEKNFTLFLEPGMERSISISKNKKGEYAMRLISDVPVGTNPPPPPSQPVYNYNTTGTPQPAQQNGVNLNMNVNETGAGINMNTPEGGVNVNVNVQEYGNPQSNQPVPPPPPMSQGCMYPMNGSDFGALKSSVSSKSFEDSKLTIAKQGLNANCLSTAQVRELLNLFTFEETKLEFAKFAFDKTTDQNNYFKVNDAFTFESSIEELNNYIESKRK